MNNLPCVISYKFMGKSCTALCWDSCCELMFFENNIDETSVEYDEKGIFQPVIWIRIRFLRIRIQILPESGYTNREFVYDGYRYLPWVFF